jgi:hypothetical protein
VKFLLRLVINIIRAPVPTYSKFDIHGCLMISPTDLTYRPKEHPKEKKKKKEGLFSNPSGSSGNR